MGGTFSDDENVFKNYFLIIDIDVNWNKFKKYEQSL